MSPNSACIERRFSTFIELASGILLLAIVGCGRSDVVAEGIIYTVEYQKPDGGSEGFTRLNRAAAVPGGNGSWNIDARGRLTREFLLITRPKHPDLGEQAIPVSRLISVQFGDGGIKTVDESKPNPD